MMNDASVCWTHQLDDEADSGQLHVVLRSMSAHAPVVKSHAHLIFRASLAANRVKLIDEHDRGGLLAGGSEKLANSLS